MNATAYARFRHWNPPAKKRAIHNLDLHRVIFHDSTRGTPHFKKNFCYRSPNAIRPVTPSENREKEPGINEGWRGVGVANRSDREEKKSVQIDNGI